MNFNKCSICNTWHFENEKCPPIFYFKYEDWSDDFVEIRAFDFEDAAINFAELYNEDESLMDENVNVIISDGVKEIEYNVSAELNINYRAENVNKGT